MPMAVRGNSATRRHGAAPSAAPPVVAAGRPTQQQGGFDLTTGYAADQNAAFRKYMEDEHVTVPDFADKRGSLYCGVYDGHGGRLAVEFVQKNLHAAVEREMRSAPAGEPPHEAIKRGFLKTDRLLLQCGAIQVGTTVAVCLCMPRPGGALDLLVANAGDSRVVLVSDDGAKRLSVDHVATDPSEVRGVQERGGHVVNNRVGGTLAVTRALGDHSLKGGSGGVTAEPYCCTHTCGAADRFVVMASDGVWDVISDADVQRLVLQHAHLPPPEIAQKLVQAAIAGMSRDNISALVVRLR